MLLVRPALASIVVLAAIASAACSKKMEAIADAAVAPTPPGTLNVALDGFAHVCGDRIFGDPGYSSGPVVAVVQTDGGMRSTNQTLAGKYYVDGVFYQPGVCDVVSACTRVSSTKVDLHDYTFLKNQLDPGGMSYSPAFHATELTGTLDILIEYYADPSCSVPKQLHQIVTR